MAAWQWYESQMDQFNCFFGDTGPAHWVFYRKVETAFNDLGLDLFPRSMGGHNTCYSVEHGKEDLLDENGDEYEQSEQVYDVAGQEYQVCFSFFVCLLGFCFRGNLKAGPLRLTRTTVHSCVLQVRDQPYRWW